MNTLNTDTRCSQMGGNIAIFTSQDTITIDRVFSLFIWRLLIIRGPESSVGIAAGYGLNGPGIESRWGARFSAPVQTGPGAHPAFCTMGTGAFPGVKSGWGVTLTPHPLQVPWS